MVSLSCTERSRAKSALALAPARRFEAPGGRRANTILAQSVGLNGPQLLATVSTGHRQGQRAALLSLLHARSTSDLANVEGGIRDIFCSDETCKYDIAGYVTCHVCIEWEEWCINDYFHGKKSITTKYPLNANSVTQSLCTEPPTHQPCPRPPPPS